MSRPSIWLRAAPLLLLGAGLAAFAVSGWGRYLTLDALAAHQAAIQAWIAAKPLLAPVAFMALYTLAAALALPGAAILSVTGGVFFGTWLGAAYALVGATIGASLLFLAARTALAGPLRRRAGPLLRRLEAGFQRDAFNYLLFLRLVPAFPFWLVNLAPALLGMRLPPYVLATVIGIAPGAVVFAGIGNGLRAVLARGEAPGAGIVLEPRILLPLAGLGLLSLAPIAYRRWVARA